MELFWKFISFQDPNVVFVVLGVILFSAASALAGSFTLLRKRALTGDAIAHAVLPGICLAFILSGDKNPIHLFIGSIVTSSIAVLVLDMIRNYSKIKEDAAIGIVLSVFFGIGVMLLSMIQHSNNANQSGLDHFIFGKTASLIMADVVVFGSVSIFICLIIILLYKDLLLVSFDKVYAISIGKPVKLLEVILMSITVLAVVTGIQAVGVVLMSAMLITPAACARFWTNNLKIMLLLAVGIAIFAGVFGAFISYINPSMPTGPWIVLVVSLIALVSFFFAPNKGILSKLMRRRAARHLMSEENLLKALYQLGEENNSFETPRTTDDILNKRGFHKNEILNTAKRLIRQGYLSKNIENIALTKEGIIKGRRITRLHRLWELYLTEIVHIAPDHVHDDAESMEHIITPELENELLKRLNYPTIDPHNTVIPKE